jgi:BirA family transcriptional regulator, biotin operon repressor / biotin---[acetyl-CoA-carboxylase] ligase
MRTRQDSNSSTVPKLGIGRGVSLPRRHNTDASSIGILSDDRESKGLSYRSPLRHQRADASSIGILSDQRESKGLSYHFPLLHQRSQLLIANLELKLHLTTRKTNHMQFSNRKFSAIFHSNSPVSLSNLPVTRHPPLITAFLVLPARLKYASLLPMPTARMATLPGTTDRRIDALLALLAENSTIVISGAKIAQEIGVSRQQVWRWIEKLRALGVRVKGHAATGYHIERVPDILAPQLLSNQLSGTTFARRIYHFFKIDSTNTVAMQLGEAGEPHGAVVLAEEQTAGRGRAGRKWLSEKSAGIHCTVLLRPQIPPAYAPLLTLVAGLAARDACAEEIGAANPDKNVVHNLDIRWPNDLLFGGRKFSGILTEMHAEPDRVHYAVIGIGINVNQTKMPAELADIATSLRIETGKPHSRLQLLIRLLRHLDRYYNQFIAEGAEPILRRFAEVSTYFKGKHVKISTATETFTGITAGLEPSGVLRVKRDDGRGTELILSGDVSEAS